MVSNIFQRFLYSLVFCTVCTDIKEFLGCCQAVSRCYSLKKKKKSSIIVVEGWLAFEKYTMVSFVGTGSCA